MLGSLFNFNPDQEKEVSSGAVIGWVLLGFAILVIVAFGIFVGVKKLSPDDSKDANPVQIEQQVETEEAIEE